MSPVSPPDDEDDRVIEALDAGEPPRSPEEAKARLPYQRLIERVRDLDELEPPPGWEQRAERRWHERASNTETRRRWRRATVALTLGAVAAAAAAIFLLRPCSAPSSDMSLAVAVEVAILPPAGVSRRSAGLGVVGDELRVRARGDAVHIEIRIYRDSKLVARCPGDPRCQPEAPGLAIQLALTDEGSYRPIVLSSRAPIPAPGDDMDSDLRRARAADVVITSQETITVRR